MSLVVVERRFPRPVAFEDIQAIEERGKWCREAYRLRYLMSYFSQDRQRMICVYEAPDAESVRLAQEKAGVPFDRAWPALVIGKPADEPESDAIVVERTLSQPVDEAAIRQAAERGLWCLEQRGCRTVRSYLSLDGLRVICVYAGPDAESIRQAQKPIGLPYDGAWPATVLRPPGPALPSPS
jgi:Protein of unknown function (DUF4242)